MSHFFTFADVMYHTRTASFLALCFMVIYGSAVAILVYRMGRGVYQGWKRAARLSPVAGYAAFAVYSLTAAFAAFMGYVFGHFPAGPRTEQDAVLFRWVFPVATASALYGYWRMKMLAGSRGENAPTFLQMLDFTTLK